MNELGHHEGGIEAIAIARDGSVFSCGRDGRVISWRGAPEAVLTREPSVRARTIAIAGDDTIVLGTLDGHVLRVRGGEVDEPYGVFADGHAGVGSVAVSFDGAHVAIGAGLTQFAIHRMDGPRVWRGSTYKWPYVVAFSPFDRRVLCATWQPDLHLVDLDALPEEGDLYGSYSGQGPVFAGAFLRDGRVVTAGATDEGGFVMVEDQCTVTEHGVYAVVAFEHVLVAGGNDQALTAYDANTGERRGSLTLGEPWSAGRDFGMLPSHAPFEAASGASAIVALARRGDEIVCATAGGRLLGATLSELL